MSPEEKRDQKAKVLLEYSETNEEIAALEVKAKRMGADIAKFGELMRRSPATNIYRREQEQYGLPVESIPSAIIETMKGWEQSFEVADKLRQARRRLSELEEQKRQLHLA